MEVLLGAVPVGSTLRIQLQGNSTLYQIWIVNNVTVVSNSYVQYNVTLLSSTNTFGNNNNLLLIVGYVGATGAQGPQGDTGETGATGPQGAPGSIGTYDQVLTAGNTAFGQTADITGPTTLGTATSSVSNTSIIITDTDAPTTSIFQAIYTIKGLSYTSNTPSGSDSLAISLNNTGTGGSSGIFHDDFYTPPSNFMISTTGELNLLGVTVVAPTPTPATLSDTQVATTAFVQNAITEVGGSNTYNQVLTNGNTATDKSAIITGPGTIGTVTNTTSKFNNNIRDTDGTAYKESFVQNNNFSLGATNGTVSESMVLQLDGGGVPGFCGIQHTDGYATKAPFTLQTPLQLDLETANVYVPNSTASARVSIGSTFGIGLVNTTNQTGLSYTGLTTVLNTGGSCNVNAVGTMDATNKGVGYTSNPQLTLNNTNTTVGSTIGVPTMEFFKSGRNGSTSDIVGQLNFFGKDASGSKVQFGGIESLITSAGGGGGVDGALDFYTCVNNTSSISGKSLVMRLNGADNENNSFRPLDMNGNPIRTSTGNLTIEASTSVGTGNLNLFAKQHIQLIPGLAGDIIGTTTNGNVSLTANEPGGTVNGFCILNADRGVSLTSALGGSNGNIILDVNNIGDLQLAGSTLESVTASASSGKYLRIKLNNVYYKIALLAD